MPLFTSSTPFDPDVEKATSEMNTVEDWGLIMDICDKVKNNNGSKDCLRSIVKRLNHRVPFVAMQALTMLHACVNNCGREFHLEICSRDFIAECRTLINQKAHPRVAQKLKFLIKTWAEMKEFKEDAALNLIPTFYDSLKKEKLDFADPDASPKTTVKLTIALSLQEEKTGHKTSSGLYPTTFGASGSSSSPRVREVRKVRALYDFEAVEDNELTFNEEVEVKTIEAPEQLDIDEEKIDDMLQQIQNADPTGETRPDAVEMLQKHADLCGINTKVLEALQMYHNLMKETPLPFQYKTMSGYSAGAMGMPPGQSSQFCNARTKPRIQPALFTTPADASPTKCSSFTTKYSYATEYECSSLTITII
ncbi:STAM2-like protein [Mya arenaria]|uniref:STAM2-like protein n=1 Tax=Mya arenaria TaxID=6604 RepID=A0ABY7F5W0_MYAAR|nr:STAM2-like protein [Mya arenaria]